MTREGGVAHGNVLVELADEDAVRALRPRFEVLRRLSFGVIATARAAGGPYDFVSRYFAAPYGIDEDPVTGGAHCSLAPYWAGGSARRVPRLAGVRAWGRAWGDTGGDRVRLARSRRSPVLRRRASGCREQGSGSGIGSRRRAAAASSRLHDVLDAIPTGGGQRPTLPEPGVRADRLTRPRRSRSRERQSAGISRAPRREGRVDVSTRS